MRLPAPWTVEKIPGGFKVLDANGQSLAYVYSRETKDAANIAGVLTEDEAPASALGEFGRFSSALLDLRSAFERRVLRDTAGALGEHAPQFLPLPASPCQTIAARSLCQLHQQRGAY